MGMFDGCIDGIDDGFPLGYTEGNADIVGADDGFIVG